MFVCVWPINIIIGLGFSGEGGRLRWAGGHTPCKGEAFMWEPCVVCSLSRLCEVRCTHTSEK